MSWRQFEETDPEKRDLELVQGSHYFNHHIPIVLQHGPTCGIALLASLILKKDPTVDLVSTANELLCKAIEMGVSKCGELMSPVYLSKLCELSGVQHHVERVTRHTDIANLLEDSVLAIIYDKDKNNEPTTVYQGERAHWLLLTGFCYKTAHQSSTSLQSSKQQQPLNSFVKSKAGKNSDKKEVYVFVQHGKSRLRQLWRWSDILDSNESVRRPKPGEWVVPDNLHLHVADTLVRVKFKM